MTKTSSTKPKAQNPNFGDPIISVLGFKDTRKREWVEVTYKGKSALLEYSDFATEKSKIWTKLCERGITIVNAAVKNTVIQKVDELDEFEPKLIFWRPGWCKGQFANANGKVFAPDDETDGAVAFSPNRSKCARRGNHATWLKHVGAKLVGHPIPSFFVMAAFAAPLLELSGRPENFGFEIAGQGGKGKSTTQRLMASVAGRPADYMITFDATRAGIEMSMEAHSDMPFIIDEANLLGAGESESVTKRKLRDFAFQMYNGRTKSRFNDPEQRAYRFVYVISANKPFSAMLNGTDQSTADAATDRLMTITVPEGDAGVFGPLPDGYQTYREFTLALETAMGQHYGTALPRFLTKLVNMRHRDEDKLKHRIRRKIEEFKREIGVNDNNGSDVRVAEAFGLVYAAGHLARYHEILPAELDCLEAAIHCYANFRATVPVRQTLRERLLAIAARPQTMTIDHKNLPTLSDEEMDAAGAFIRMVKGERLLLLMPDFGNLTFRDWATLKDTADFRKLHKGDKDGGRGYHTRVRRNSKSDWLYAFRFPGDEADEG